MHLKPTLRFFPNSHDFLANSGWATELHVILPTAYRWFSLISQNVTLFLHRLNPLPKSSEVPPQRQPVTSRNTEEYEECPAVRLIHTHLYQPTLSRNSTEKPVKIEMCLHGGTSRIRQPYTSEKNLRNIYWVTVDKGLVDKCQHRYPKDHSFLAIENLARSQQEVTRGDCSTFFGL